MSDRIGSNGGPLIPGGFEVVDDSEFDMPADNQEVGGKKEPAGSEGISEFEDVDIDPEVRSVKVGGLMQNGRVSGGDQISNAQKAIISNLQMPKPEDSFLHKIGRWFLGLINKIGGRVMDSSAAEFSAPKNLEALRGKMSADLPPLERGPAFRLENKDLGKLAGLGEDVKITPFEDYPNRQYGNEREGFRSVKPSGFAVLYDTAREYGEAYGFKENDPNCANEPMVKNIKEYGVLKKETCAKLFPHGEPRLSDIKQRASLQDCWFLSSIGAVISTQGPQAISRLFSESDQPGCVRVRLGNHHYDVPMGDLVNSRGERFGSNSANWVKALELGMLMHTMNTAPVGGQDHVHDLKFWQRSAAEGITALQGIDAASNKGARMEYLMGTPDEKLQAIRKALNNKVPVVLGHNGGKFDSLKDGIAPGHAVTVIRVGTEALEILDPYGEVKVISKDALARCNLLVGSRAPGQDEEFHV